MWTKGLCLCFKFKAGGWGSSHCSVTNRAQFFVFSQCFGGAPHTRGSVFRYWKNSSKYRRATPFQVSHPKTFCTLFLILWARNMHASDALCISVLDLTIPLDTAILMTVSPQHLQMLKERDSYRRGEKDAPDQFWMYKFHLILSWPCIRCGFEVYDVHLSMFWRGWN